VVAVGPGLYEHGQHTPVGVKVGDVLAYQDRSGVSFNWNGEPYILLSEGDVLFIDDGVK
jgi:chaperonin GroES